MFDGSSIDFEMGSVPGSEIKRKTTKPKKKGNCSFDEDTTRQTTARNFFSIND